MRRHLPFAFSRLLKNGSGHQVTTSVVPTRRLFMAFRAGCSPRALCLSEFFRALGLPALVLALLFGFGARPLRAAEIPDVSLYADHTSGRPVEELTRKAVARDYASAWRTLEEALGNNNAGLLENDFVGIAQQKLQEKVAEQAKAGLRTRYLDHGHKLDVLFYSPEGSSIQVRDTARLEIQVLDGDTLVHSEQVTLHYISLLTPTEVRWKVRLLQAVPEQSEISKE